jgi:hypothetical protein
MRHRVVLLEDENRVIVLPNHLANQQSISMVASEPAQSLVIVDSYLRPLKNVFSERTHIKILYLWALLEQVRIRQADACSDFPVFI